MAHHVAHGATTVRKLDLHAFDIEDLTAPHGLLRQDLLMQLGVMLAFVAGNQVAAVVGRGRLLWHRVRISIFQVVRS